MSIAIITGWIAAILMIGNFATCLAMPWAIKKFAGCDPKECKGKEKSKCHAEILGRYHKPFVWLTIFATIIHIIFAIIG